MELWEAIKGRRSVRRFAERPVERERLERLVEAAVWAPSGGNAQTWRFVVLTTRNSVRRLKAVSPGLLGDPPALVAVCQDLAEVRRRGGTLGETFLAPVDAAMAAQNLLLAAHAEGLGTCVIASFHRGGVARLLGLEAAVEPILLVSVGWAAETPSPPPRREGRVAFTEVRQDVR
ncbi:MAG: nitroreductase family protein [Candidatus Bipolaricaulota bacterium]|nr:nitroreductase family protein [Candidatus Bipolaricaulota bacterium]